MGFHFHGQVSAAKNNLEMRDQGYENVCQLPVAASLSISENIRTKIRR